MLRGTFSLAPTSRLVAFKNEHCGEGVDAAFAPFARKVGGDQCFIRLRARHPFVDTVDRHGYCALQLLDERIDLLRSEFAASVECNRVADHEVAYAVLFNERANACDVGAEIRAFDRR